MSSELGASYLPSPVWGEGGERREPGEGISEPDHWLRAPLAPTLSRTGRGSAGPVPGQLCGPGDPRATRQAQA